MDGRWMVKTTGGRVRMCGCRQLTAPSCVGSALIRIKQVWSSPLRDLGPEPRACSGATMWVEHRELTLVRLGCPVGSAEYLIIARLQPGAFPDATNSS